MAILQQAQGLIGIALLLMLVWGLSENRSARPSWRWIGAALLLQFGLAILLVRVPFVWSVVTLANHAVRAIEKATLVGSSYMFGYVGGAPLPFALGPGQSAPVIIAFQILPLVIVFSALSALPAASPPPPPQAASSRAQANGARRGRAGRIAGVLVGGGTGGRMAAAAGRW